MNTSHNESWWAEFELSAEKFDAASVTEALTEALLPGIPSLLLRRESEIAADTVLRWLNKRQSAEREELAAIATVRLIDTVARLNLRSISDDAGTAAAEAVCLVLQGHFAQAAALVEPVIGTDALLRAFVGALRQDKFGSDLAMELLGAGHSPATAVRSSRVLGRYGWWPKWLLTIVTERVAAGTLDTETVHALQECAYARLSPSQARMATRLMNAEPQLVEAAAARLEGLGEHTTAVKLRRGDVTTVAFAAKLIPV